jgi:hypothetical protein
MVYFIAICFFLKDGHEKIVQGVEDFQELWENGWA